MVCKYNASMRHEFSWSRGVCSICNRKISVKQGKKCLRKHQDSAEHLRAVAARKCFSQDVKSALVAHNDSPQHLMLNALISHCLKLVPGGNSFRSSDDFTEDVRLYSRMFLDSKNKGHLCHNTWNWSLGCIAKSIGVP